MAKNAKFLIINYHNLYGNQINRSINIEIYNKKKMQIILDMENCIFYEDIDITIIEIKGDYEIINDIVFLDYDLDYTKGYDIYLNKDLFILQFPKNEIEIASGKIMEILNNNEFKHNLDVEIGSSGSPIILTSTLKVIGIHKEGDQFSSLNIGLFLGELFKKNNDRFKDNIIIEDYFSNPPPVSNTLQTKEIDMREIIENDILRETSKEKQINKDNSNNYITGEICVYKKDISKSLRIINSYEEFNRRSNNSDMKKDCCNEKEIKECIIEVNNRLLLSFSYGVKFEKEGKYKIKYNFPIILTNCNHIFANCSSLINLDFSNFNSENVTDMTGMLSGCSSLKDLDISNFNTKNVKDMSSIFENCPSLQNIYISNFITKNVTNMHCIFSGCSSLKNLDLSNFNTDNVTDMSGIFSRCSSLTNLNLSNFSTKKVTNMSYMFSGCSSLNNLELSNFNTEKVINMSGIFSKCSSLKSLSLSNFITKNVTDMSYMFSGCSSLQNLNLSNFNTQNVTNMKEMFRDCTSFTNLDLSNFNTKNLTYISAMFRGCSSLVKLDLSNFNTKNVKDLDSMCLIFNNCLALDKRYFVTKDSKILDHAKLWLFFE